MVSKTAAWRVWSELTSVFTSAVSAVVDTSKILRAADAFVFNTRQVLCSAASDCHDRVLLGIVALTGDVCSDDLAVGQTDSARLTVGRVGLTWLQNNDLKDNAVLLRVSV
jgi:hypothetical protein